jgi:hypothetical protein
MDRVSSEAWVRIEDIVAKWPIPGIVIQPGIYKYLVGRTTQVIDEVLQGSYQIARSRGSERVDSRAVQLYIKLFKLDGPQALDRIRRGAITEFTPSFVLEDQKALAAALNGPMDFRITPLPEPVWQAVWQTPIDSAAWENVENEAVKEISNLTNRAFLELFGTTYLIAWKSLSRCLEDFQNFGISILGRPQRVVLQKRQISESCELLPFPLNFLD